MLILGFGNKARQGKDTAAEAIRDYYNSRNELITQMNGRHKKGYAQTEGKNLVRVGIFKFATALYQEVNSYLKSYKAGHVVGWQNFYPALDIQIPDWIQPDPNPEVSELAPYGKHPKLLQWWGTEYRRAQDPDYWTKKLFASIPPDTNVALVTDVRFPNEADGVKERGGYNINVQRLHKDGRPFYSGDRPVDHPSETALDCHNWDFLIVNMTGHQALLAEVAVTHAEYLRALGPSK